MTPSEFRAWMRYRWFREGRAGIYRARARILIFVERDLFGGWVVSRR